MYMCRFGTAVCGSRTSNGGEHVESDDVVFVLGAPAIKMYTLMVVQWENGP